MFRVVRASHNLQRKWQHVDLKTLRETLAYMESDCKVCPGLERVAVALEHAISEIDHVRTQPEPSLHVVSARFIPAGL